MKKSIALLLVGAASLAACTEVPTGSRGVKASFGEVQGDALGEGLAWYNPFTEDVKVMSVQTLKWSSVTEAYTKDVQAAKISFTVVYNLKPAKVIDMYRQVGAEWADALIPQVVYRSIKDVVGQHEAVKDVINNRPAVQALITQRIIATLLAKGINVTGFDLTDVSFSEAFENAVEAKQIAVENANAARNKTVEVQEQANQRVIAAEADAKAMQIKTAALSGSPKLVEWEAVQKWDGHMPQYMMGGATPFIQMPGK